MKLDNLVTRSAIAFSACLFLSGCAPTPGMTNMMKGGPMSRGMMRMMGMGDMANALNNVDDLMPKGMSEIEQIAMAAQKKAVADGEKIFNDPEIGNSGLSCNSCHPGGGTTGGSVPLPMRAEFKVRVPDLHGAAATFPKFKVPSGRVISLEQMNTNCVRMFVMGRYLSDEDSQSLAAFVTSLSRGSRIP